MAADQTTNESRRSQSAADRDVQSARGAEGASEEHLSPAEEKRADEPVAEIVEESGVEDAAAELAACQDRLLRLQAEMENLRRRTAREIADERRYAALPFVRDLLDVLDNVDRAVEAGEKTSDAETLLEGFRLVAKQLRSLLEKHNVQPIAAEGQPFDPNLHEAILQQPSDKPSGTIVLVTQGGYQLHDRVVRPSQVIVSAGEA